MTRATKNLKIEQKQKKLRRKTFWMAWNFGIWLMGWRDGHLTQTILSVIPRHERKISVQYMQRACMAYPLSASRHPRNDEIPFFAVCYSQPTDTLLSTFVHDTQHIWLRVHWRSDDEKKWKHNRQPTSPSHYVCDKRSTSIYSVIRTAILMPGCCAPNKSSLFAVH